LRDPVHKHAQILDTVLMLSYVKILVNLHY